MRQFKIFPQHSNEFLLVPHAKRDAKESLRISKNLERTMSKFVLTSLWNSVRLNETELNWTYIKISMNWSNEKRHRKIVSEIFWSNIPATNSSREKISSDVNHWALAFVGYRVFSRRCRRSKRYTTRFEVRPVDSGCKKNQSLSYLKLLTLQLASNPLARLRS